MRAPDRPVWVTASFDSPVADELAAFWCRVTGSSLSPWREDRFATFEPPAGTPYLRVQRCDRERMHLDLHVADVDGWTARAVRLGAEVVARPGHVVVRSPGGLLCCLVPPDGLTMRTSPVTWGDHTSLLDQISVDIPADIWVSETAFWAALTGWPVKQLITPEFDRLDVPVAQPWRILLQRRGDAGGEVRAHVDLATDDRAAEVARHLACGAGVVAERRRWTVMRPSVGSDYCITDRDPATGALPP